MVAETRDEQSGAGTSELPLVSVVIPTFNKWEYTEKCLTAIFANTRYPRFEVIVVDNASSDETPERLKAIGPPLRLRLNPENEGFARGSNQGAAMANGELILFLNNDTEPFEGWMTELVRVVLQYPDVAIVGSQLLFPNGTIQHAGVVVNYGGLPPIAALHAFYQRPPSEGPQGLTEFRCVTAACMLIRRTVFEEVEHFDELYVNGYEDVDLCFKVVERGHRIIYNPRSIAVHHESVSEGRHRYEDENLWLLTKRWLGRFTLFDENRYVDIEPTPANPTRPGVSVVLPICESLLYIVSVLERLVAHTGAQDEIIVVDQGSRDPSSFVAQWFSERFPGRIKVLERESPFRALSEVWSVGLQESANPYLVLCSPYLWVTKGWLDRLVGHLEGRPDLGMISPMTDYAVGQQEVGRLQKFLGGCQTGDDIADRLQKRALTPLDVEALSPVGACVRREVLASSVESEPESFYDARGFRLPQSIRSQGRAVAIARDAFVQNLWPPRNLGPLPVHAMLQRRTNNMHQELTRRLGDKPTDQLWAGSRTAPQLERVSLVLNVHDDLGLTEGCVSSLLEHSREELEWLLVTNDCGDAVVEFLKQRLGEHSGVRWVRDQDHREQGAALNRALALSTGSFIVVLEGDVVVGPNWLSDQLALFGGTDKVGAVGPRTTRSAVEHGVESGEPRCRSAAELSRFTEEWEAREGLRFTSSDPIVGPCLVLDRSVVDTVGGFDTTFWTKRVQHEDLYVRITRAGFLGVVAHDVILYQADGDRVSESPEERSRLELDGDLFALKWDCAGRLGPETPVADLISSPPVDLARERVEPRMEERLARTTNPVVIEGEKEVMVLMIPDWRREDWRAPMETFLRCVSASDSVGLIVRVEPPTLRHAEAVLASLTGFLEGLDIQEEELADIVLETSLLGPSDRGRLYSAAEALLPVGGARSELYKAEAELCGLRVLPSENQVSLKESLLGLLSR